MGHDGMEPTLYLGCVWFNIFCETHRKEIQHEAATPLISSTQGKLCFFFNPSTCNLCLLSRLPKSRQTLGISHDLHIPCPQG